MRNRRLCSSVFFNDSLIFTEKALIIADASCENGSFVIQFEMRTAVPRKNEMRGFMLTKKRRIFAVGFCVLLGFALLCGTFVLSVNAYVVKSTEDRFLSAEEAALLENVDCVLVLGCLVKADGTPSDMLHDRLLTGVTVYEKIKEGQSSVKLLMSGDHGREEYNEVYAMKGYAVEQGIPSSEVFMDHAGFSTYESVYRAKEIFGAERIVIVTQGYHLSRALHIADALGVDAYGVSADVRTYRGQILRDVREILARNKDFLTAIVKPEPTYLGEPISLDGNGDVTNDD